MPRRLSNAEFVFFSEDVDLNNLNLPSWGGVIRWGNQYVLAYKPAGSKEWQLSDVSDGIPYGDEMVPIENIVRTVPQYETSSLGVFVFEFGKAFIENAGERLEGIARLIGKTAGDLTAPLLGNLAMPLAAVGIALVIFYGPKINRG